MNFDQVQTTFDDLNAVYLWGGRSNRFWARTVDQPDPTWLIRRVRGSKMRTERRLYDEFSAAFQFPSYFGENSNAFDECITDLSWIHSFSSIMVAVDSPSLMLDAEASDALPWLVRRIIYAKKIWQTPITNDGEWNRPAVPFNVVLFDPEAIEATETRWSNAGAEVKLLEE